MSDTTTTDTATPKATPADTLLRFEQQDLVIWDINWNTIHPFNPSLEEKLWLGEWMIQAFDELIEMQEIGGILQRFQHSADPALVKLELTGKYRYLSLEEVGIRFRHLKAFVRFIAEYGNNTGWMEKMESFENGDLDHS